MITTARRTKYFDGSQQNDRVDLGSGFQAYKGYFRRIQTSLSGLILNLNSSAAVFHKDVRLDLIKAGWQSKYTRNPNLLHTLQRFFNNLRVRRRFGNGSATPVRIVSLLNNNQAIPNVTF